MSDREAGSLGRMLALVLRHAPEKFNVEMDINGWVSTRELADSISGQRRHYHWLRGWHFEAIANADEKGRYQVEGEMIRATYGTPSRLNSICQPTRFLKHFTGHVSLQKLMRLYS